ncbi:PspA/IM30 family protein [Metabacillus herbersteinensis]|uniref:PspA/IM30 family protein n=1 Tax=Metabacillus herbersteinensis TaxID=283816 RepID=A0ABV6GGE7_9BACI
MSLFKRIRDNVMSNVNAALDKAEDPEKLLEQYLRDMSADILEAERAVAKQITVEKKFKMQLSDAEEMVEKRGEQALKALEAGNEDLARRALVDKQEYEKKLVELQGSYDAAKQNAEDLRSRLSEMKSEFEKMKHRKDTLKARASSAKAQKEMNQAMSSFGTDNARQGFDRLEDKIMQLEAEAETSEDLRGSNKSLDDELESIGNPKIEDELAAMKAKIGKKSE